MTAWHSCQLNLPQELTLPDRAFVIHHLLFGTHCLGIITSEGFTRCRRPCVCSFVTHWWLAGVYHVALSGCTCLLIAVEFLLHCNLLLAAITILLYNLLVSINMCSFYAGSGVFLLLVVGVNGA